MWLGLSTCTLDMEHRHSKGAWIWKDWEVHLSLPQQLVWMLEVCLQCGGTQGDWLREGKDRMGQAPWTKRAAGEEQHTPVVASRLAGGVSVAGEAARESSRPYLEGPECLQLQLWLLHSRLGEVGKLKALVWHLVQKCLEMCCRVSTFFLKDGVLSSMAKSKECLFYNPKLFHLLMFSFCLMLV